MNIKRIFSFLQELSRNNNREWFNDNREEYEAVKIEFDIFTGSLIERLGTFEDGIKGMQPSQCTYRIYRDTRFSADKTPYKTHIGAYVNSHGKKSTHCGYYVHIEPGNCMICVGSICWPSNILKALRKDIVENIDEYRSIVDNSEFKRYFPQIGEERLKTAPRDFPKDYEYIDYIKPKDFSCSYRVDDSFFLDNSETLMDRIEAVFKVAKPFVDFTNCTIDDYE